VADPETGCWLWTGSTAGKGYPSMTYNGRTGYVTRFILGIEDRDRWSQACHKCDTPLCIRPEHLFVGTPQDNMNDKIAKGRQVLPPPPDRDQMRQTKIKTSEFQRVAELRRSGMTKVDIGKMFDCGPSCVERVLARYEAANA